MLQTPALSFVHCQLIGDCLMIKGCQELVTRVRAKPTHLFPMDSLGPVRLSIRLKGGCRACKHWHQPPAFLVGFTNKHDWPSITRSSAQVLSFDVLQNAMCLAALECHDPV